MNIAYPTDWKAMGLDFRSPFEILSLPRAPIKEAPPKPKKVRKTMQERVIASLQDLPNPSHFNTDIMTRAESDRTLSIHGRGLS